MSGRCGPRWNSNLIVLGDFNLDRIGDPLYEAFISTGLWPPAELKGLAYGQRAGTFDSIPHVFQGLTRSEVSWLISDHYPFWCESLWPDAGVTPYRK
jgi:hypothetical protein